MHKSELANDPMAQVGWGGCAVPYLEGFAAELLSTGYAVLTTRAYVRAAAHLGRWADGCGIAVNEFTDRTVARFAEHRCECGGHRARDRRPSRRYVARVRRFVEYLGRLGVGPPVVVAPPKHVPAPLIGLRAWMTRHRGVSERTIDRYERLIERLLPALGDDPARCHAALVRRVLLNEVRNRSRAYAKTFVAALRAFLRFLAAEGRCQPHLHRAVPTVREWKLSALPRYLEAGDVERVIASCDMSKAQGVRDRAVLLLLARLGLRGGDIVAMRLDDLDWDAGTVRVRGKACESYCISSHYRNGPSAKRLRSASFG